MAQNKQRGLGKGLGAIFGDIPTVSGDSSAPASTLPIEQLEPNPNQPRREFPPEELDLLADSIRQHGIIAPITVRKLAENQYQIIAGERRWRAARQAQLAEVPVYIREADEQTVMELALIENLQRQDLNPLEEAHGYQTLMTRFHLTQDAVAESVGKSRPAVSNALRLLSLPEALQTLVKDGRLSAGHARALLPLRADLQKELAEKVIAQQLSVRQTEALVKQLQKEDQMHDEPEPVKSIFEVDYIAECEKSLSKQLGRGVKIIRGKRKGRFELEFYDDDDLQTLIAALESLRGGALGET